MTVFPTESLRRERASVLQKLVHRELIRLHAWNDERAAAVRQYRECVRILDRELGVPPLEETTALYEAVVAGAPPPAPARRPQPSATPAQLPPGRVTQCPLVDRDAELATLLERHAAITRDGHLIWARGRGAPRRPRGRACGLARRGAGAPAGDVQPALGLSNRLRQ